MAKNTENVRKFEAAGVIEKLWLSVEKTIDALTTSEYNPFYYIGAIGIFFLWIIIISGIYLFIFYTITARGAYDSVERLTADQWYLGGVMRSLHRYSAEGLVFAGIMHTLRCYALDRYKRWRWIAWVSGVILMWIIWIGGIFGYWMVWDERAKFIALSSSRMLESVPFLGMPLSISFASIQNITDEFFYIILVIHFFSIVVVFILLMVHLSRITKAIITPPRVMAYAVVITLLVIALIHPAVSAPPADLKKLSPAVPFDWLFMFVYPLLRHMPARAVWLFVVSVTMIVAIVPWLTREESKAAAVVTYRNCTGCELCMEDCPYEAIRMRPRTDDMPYDLEAVVNPKRCASCGVCTGSCDYKAMSLPDMTEDYLKSEIKRLSEALKEEWQDTKVLVFSCAKGVYMDGGESIKGFEWARVLTLQCIGQLQPSMIAMSVEDGLFDGVFIAGCVTGDCHFRRGNEWLTERINSRRPPVLKKSVDRTRIKTAWFSAVERRRFLRSLVRFHGDLKAAKRVV